jgi:hypothetical protein
MACPLEERDEEVPFYCGKGFEAICIVLGLK